jgi:hypothetical protein
VLLLGYVATVVYFHIGTPRVKRNFSAEFNARFGGVPEGEKGITEFRRALEHYETVPEELRTLWPEFFPSDPEWPRVVEYVARLDPLLTHVRDAASARVFGMEMGDGFDPTLALGAEGGAEQAVPSSENPFRLNISLPHLGAFRWCARALNADARVAADAGQSDRALADLSAILGLARHSRECETMLGDLVGNALMAMDARLAGEIIDRQPGLFNDLQLAVLQGGFLAYAGGGRIGVRFDGERAFVEDFLQRTFTDGGGGDGRFCWEGLMALEKIVKQQHGSVDKPSFLAHFTAPLSVFSRASRAEFRLEGERLLALAERDDATPRWQRTHYACDAEVDRLESDPRLESKYRFLLIIMPALRNSIESMSQAMEERDGILAALAIERYRLRSGAYPASLVELVPLYLSSVPVDQHDGAPLKYRQGGPRPVIYSVGCDTDDDGGVPPPGWRGNDKAMPWRVPEKRHLCADGDFVLWPPVPEPRKRPDDE